MSTLGSARCVEGGRPRAAAGKNKPRESAAPASTSTLRGARALRSLSQRARRRRSPATRTGVGRQTLAFRPARIDARRPRPSSTASFASLTSPSAPTWCVTIDGRRPRLMGARARCGARADRAHPLLLPQADARVLAFMLEQNRPHGAQV